MKRIGYSLSCCFISLYLHAEPGRVELTILDSQNHLPTPCRIHLKNAEGRIILREGLPKWRDHFVCPGTVILDLPEGTYSYEIDRGPEFVLKAGTFAVSGSKTQALNFELSRFVDLTEEGWWAGDLHVHRNHKDIELLMQAEDLYVAPVMTWWNKLNQWATNSVPSRLLVQFDKNRFYHLMAGEDEREGGALLYFNLSRPLPIAGSAREYPSPMKFLEQARSVPGAHIDIEKPFWWDVPIWLASEKVDSIGIANNHMCRDQMYESEAWGKARDTNRLAAPRGNGFWSQEIYYQILNCGLRIPPSAGTASGVLPNPLGYNRVYVHVGKKLDYDKWWAGLRAGRSFVSNGPLLRCRANGELPGHVFKSRKPITIELGVSLCGRDPMSSIEIIKNGRIERVISLQSWDAVQTQHPTSQALMDRTGNLGAIEFDHSGWFLVRVICDNPKTFRFASTAPFYVEVGSAQRRISHTSVKFFVDWVRERAKRVNLTDPDQKQEVMQYHEMGERFWQSMLNTSNAE